jgi:hypothetical protein
MGTFTTAAQTTGLNPARNAAVDAMVALANSGSLRIYDGTAPANADASLSGNTLLAELALSSTAFGSAVAGVATAGTITADTSANATGTPTFFRLLASGGSTVVFQGTAGASGQELNLSGLSAGQIVAGGNVSVSSLTITQPGSFV